MYVTHDQTEAMTMADRVVVLRAGRVEQEGAPFDLYDRPANAFVASFIGSPAMTLLPARAGGGRVRLADGADAGPARPGVEGEVTLGGRPEAFRDPSGPFSLLLDVTEATGGETQLVGRIAGAPARALLRERLPPAPAGALVPLAADPAGFHLFDREGRRL